MMITATVFVMMSMKIFFNFSEINFPFSISKMQILYIFLYVQQWFSVISWDCNFHFSLIYFLFLIFKKPESDSV